ncbi:MAG: amidohydrolase [Clostridia bacterium]|jgi:5-methylthioadenosine/S-adenosylhomocysteine deaminase|nr:amidohydrolase [Clostridia bacterium]
MKIWFYNAQILQNCKIISGDVLVEDEKIVYVGKNPPVFDADRKIDVKNNILMSGFVNTHSHIPSTIMRGYADDMPLDLWLDKIIPIERKMTENDIYWSTMLGVMEYVRAGITCVEENYSFISPIMNALKKAGMRARISLGYPNVNQTKKVNLEQQFKEIKKNNFKAVCFAHSVYGTSQKQFDELIVFAGKNNLSVSTHLSETLKEVGDCTVKYDKTPVEYLEYLGFLDRPCTIYHAVHTDKDDLKILADYNVNVVTCPSSNLKLASGIAPIYAMQTAGINIAIGTDGAYSNNSYDMFKEMFLTATLNKTTLYNAEILKAKEILKMSTINGAKSLGFDNLGDIKEGYFADLILIDIDKPHHFPHNNLVSNLVYSAKSSDVYLTMINGKIVYENDIFNFDEKVEKIYSECKKIKSKIL